MLAYFSSFVRKLPISYITFVYRRSQFEDPARLMERMRCDVSFAMIEHLGFFQSGLRWESWAKFILCC